MARDLIIAMDAGTSVIKALVFDLKGQQLADAARPNTYTTGSGGAVEQDMARTWSDSVAVLAELTGKVGDLKDRAAVLAITGQGDGTWLMDKDGNPTAPAWLWLDSRAAGIVHEMDAKGVRQKMYHRTGCGLNACNSSSQLAWMQRHTPEVLARSATANHCKDWLYFGLTGERVTDVTEGVFTFGDFRSRDYVPEILDWMGIADQQRLLPEMVDGTRKTHPLQTAAAKATGLPEGLPVSLGSVDVACTALGAGLYEPGGRSGPRSSGSTSMHMRLEPKAENLKLAPEPSGYTDGLSGAECSLAHAVQHGGDAQHRLDRRSRPRCGPRTGPRSHAQDALLALDSRVLDAKPGVEIYHPYIHEAGERGPFFNADARAQFIGLSQKTSFIDLVRTVYDGLVLAARDCYSAIGGAPSEIRIAGGAARSKALKTLLASGLGVPVRESAREEAGAAGTAMMAAVAIGAEPDMASAVKAWVTPCLGGTVEPDPALKQRYDELFPIYVKTRKMMPEIWADLTRARNKA
jgi:erythritol kinase